MLSPIPFDPPTELIGPPGDSAETGTRTLVFDLFGGTWADAEKDATSTEDDLLCWAATASNMLEYTGWGFVDGMTNADQFLDYFEQHWTDEGTRTDTGLDWWFSGTDSPPGVSPWAHVDVAGGGFYTQLNINSFMSTETNDADIMTFVDTQINGGSPVGLWVLDGFNHEITCWGFNYDPSETPGSTDYYLGVWITDSDDDKGVANGYTAPNDLHYYDVVWDAGDGRWEMPDYGNNSDLHILEAVSLQRYDAGVYAVNGDQDSVNQNDAIGVSLDATGNYLEIRINGNLQYNPLVSSVHELNIYGWGGNDMLIVDSPAAGQNRISGTSGGVAFEDLTFTSVSTFKIDTAANDAPLVNPNDIVIFASDLVASGLNSFTIETGAGNDFVNASTVISQPLTILGGDGDDTLIGGGGADRLEGGLGDDGL